MPTASPDPDLDGLLRERFGFTTFRPGQRAGIEALLRGGNLLSIQPTGHGKSLLYQLPAALLEGMTIVVSPLLALVRDQVGQLNGRFGVPAASINSDQSDDENAAARRAAEEGRVRLLFVSPEHLDHVERFEAVARLPVALLVVDEAHCISTWGHDFRPAYRQILRLVQALRERRPGLKVLALTATADARVEDDIRRQLEGPGAPQLTVHRSSMDRPNISLAVVPVASMAHKLAYLAKLLPRLPSPGILYCATREHTELCAEYLRMCGVDVTAYHAGLEPERKIELQGDFLRGRFAAIAATNALGMGIDKSDLRYVVHVDIPGSITAYYQEVGRAGRDGQPARGILLRDPDDRRIQEHFIGSAQPEPQDFDSVLAAVVGDGDPPGLTAIKVRTGLHPTRVTVVVAELVEQGFLDKRAIGGRQIYVPTGKSGAPDLERYRRQGEVRSRELGAMLRFGHREGGCLMATLRLALGDDAAEPCQRCSACRDQRSSVELGDAIAVASAWLEGRASPIAATARPPMSEGLAILDGDRGGPLFAWLMEHREALGAGSPPDDFASLIAARARELSARHAIAAVVVVPSRRWVQRAAFAEQIAAALGVPAWLDALVWRDPPAVAQGDLSNNDQRRQNVDGKLRLAPGVRLPAGDLLLLDDLVGSGATLREAGRAIRKDATWKGALVPLVIARVRRRLGAPGA